MLIKLTASVLLLFFMVGMLSAADGKKVFSDKPVVKTKTLVNDDLSANVVTPLLKQGTHKVINPAAGDVIASSQYPYFSNSIVRQQIVEKDGVPHMSPMIWPNSGSNRSVTYIRPEGGSYVGTEVPMGTGNNRSGWGAIDYPKTGTLADQVIGIVAHVPNYLFIWDGTQFATPTTIEANTDPSLVFAGDAIFAPVSGNRALFEFYRSDDFGATFSKYDDIAAYSPSPIYYGANGGVEVDAFKSPNEMYVGYVGTNANNGHVVDGVSKDSADCLWLVFSTDGGATWAGKTLGYDGDNDGQPDYTVESIFVDSATVTLPSGATETVFVGADKNFYYHPLFENFGQAHGAVGNDGVFHVVANGYGQWYSEVFTVRTGEGDVEVQLYGGDQFPVLYWNSNHPEINGSPVWISIDNYDIASFQAADRDFPGNALGQSFPQISTSEDGMVLYANWGGPQFTADTVDFDENDQYYTDGYHAFSVDGGATWTYGGLFQDKKDVGELFMHASNTLETVDANTYRAHILFVEGVSPFQNTSGTGPVCDLVYQTFDITVTGVEDGPVADSYTLSQNYPNPFNPSTTINYTLAQNGQVSLKVFDVLGSEVASLVNEVQNAGSHKVNFDASSLSSGVYVYTLTSGAFTSSQKMMLLK